MVKRLLCCLFVATSLGGLPSGSRAQSPEEVEAFKEHLADGRKAYEDEDYQRALKSFYRADEIASPPMLQYNIARSLQKLERCREAKKRFGSLLEMEDLPGDYRSRAEKHRDQLTETCPPKGKLLIECRPEETDVTVTIGSNEPRSCPAQVVLEAGTYRLEAKADGYQTTTETIEVESGTESRKTIELREAAGGSPPEWKTYAAYGGLALGAGLLAGGIGTDLATGGRVAELGNAIDARDARRVDEVRRAHERARTRAIVMYATGAAFAVGGGTLLIVDAFGESRSSTDSTVRLNVSGSGVGLAVDW